MIMLILSDFSTVIFASDHTPSPAASLSIFDWEENGYPDNGGIYSDSVEKSPEAVPCVSVKPDGNAAHARNRASPAANNKPYNTLIILSFILGLGLLGTFLILFLQRNRHMHAMQTANGGIVAQNAAGRKQTINAIKNSALNPSDDVFKLIMEKVKDKCK